MAGQAASRTVAFGSGDEPQRSADRLIQVKAPRARAPDDRARLRGQTAGLTAPEETQP
jgi:hypothetical protein